MFELGKGTFLFAIFPTFLIAIFPTLLIAAYIYRFSFSWFCSFLDHFTTFWPYDSHPGKAGNLK
ncbi:MAG: hypothetical protein WC854_14420, partial [Bacteroidales bacterium]